MKRRVVVFAPEARDDLANIYDWIEKASSASVALSFLGRVETYCLAFDLWGSAARAGTTSGLVCVSSASSAR